jgi:hypothetical protein
VSENAAIREFYSLLRATILWVKEVDLLKMQMLINEQTLQYNGEDVCG